MAYTKLIVGGFKSIKERTEIPIAPLTLIFGPNSAGKTAVVQALELLSKRLGQASEQQDESLSLARSLIALGDTYPYAHRLAGADLIDSEVKPVWLGVEFDEFPANETSFSCRLDAAKSLALDIFWNLKDTLLTLETAERTVGGT